MLEAKSQDISAFNFDSFLHIGLVSELCSSGIPDHCDTTSIVAVPS